MSKRRQTELSDYWTGIHTALNARVAAVKEYLRHPSTGFNAEAYFRNLLRDYLPSRYSVDTGFVVNAEGKRSEFIDIVIADSAHIPPLCREPHFSVFAAEAVVAGVEVTTAPKSRVFHAKDRRRKPKLQDDIEKLARFREIAKKREYTDSLAVAKDNGIEVRDYTITIELCPRSFLITCGDEWQNHEPYEQNLVGSLGAAKSNEEEVWLNGVLSMKHGFYHFTPHTTFEFNRIEKNPLLEFLLFVNRAISTYRTYRIDIGRYRPRVPNE
jgi:hypothetical protein